MGKKLEKLINGTISTATNITLGAGTIEGIKYLNSTAVSDATTGLVAFGAGASIFALNKSGLNTKLSEKIRGKKKFTRKKTASRLAKFAMVAHLGIAALIGTNLGKDIASDIKSTYNSLKSKYNKQAEEVISDFEEEIFLEPREKPSITEIIANDKHTTQGRFDRTYRWDDLIDSTEIKYGLPKGIIAGTIMQESYGNPTQLPKEMMLGQEL